MNSLGKTAAWVGALLLVSLGLSVAQVVLVDRVRARPTAPAASGSPDLSARPSLFEPSTVLEPLGRFPSSRLAYDPAVQGRLYAGGSSSEDAGATWRPLSALDGRRILLLGAARAGPPAAGPAGRLLYREVLFETPGIVTGLGAIAHAVEWREGNWETLVAADEEPVVHGLPADRWPVARVRSVAYLPTGESVIATSDSLLVGRLRSVGVPGRLHAMLVASTGAIYVAVRDPGRFQLYHTASVDSPWLPVANTGPVDALAAGAEGKVYLAAGRRLGRGGAAEWQWTSFPVELEPEHLAVHPRQDLVAAWGKGRVAVSKDGGLKVLMCRVKDVAVSWAAWDPFANDALTVLDLEGNAYRLKLDSVN